MYGLASSSDRTCFVCFLCLPVSFFCIASRACAPWNVVCESWRQVIQERLQRQNETQTNDEAKRNKHKTPHLRLRRRRGRVRDISDVTCSAGFWRKRAVSHCVECMAQLSDATIRAIVDLPRMLLLTAMAPRQADRGSLELSIDVCFVKIGQVDHLLRLLCGL